jgi:hypothetical protein
VSLRVVRSNSVDSLIHTLLAVTSISASACGSVQNASPSETGAFSTAGDQAVSLAAWVETVPWMVASRPTRAGGSADGFWS